jgi:DHA1 family multidrug resistance protein-like MFS transporter
VARGVTSLSSRRQAKARAAPARDDEAPPAASLPLEPDAEEGDGGPSRAWRRNLYALWLAQLLTIVGFSMRAPFLPFFLGDVGADSFASQALWSGIINAGGAGVMAVAAPFWGIVADRYGRKPMVVRAMFAGFCTISLMSLAQNPGQLLVLRFFEGAFTGSVTASTTLVASSTPRRNRGFALGMMQMAIFSGASAGPLLGGVLADLIGYRASFLVAGSLLLIGGLIVLFLVHEQFERPAKGEAGVAENGPSLRLILFGGAMLAMIGVLFGLRVSNSAIQPIMPLFVEEISGATRSVASLAGLALGVAGVASAVSAVTLGRLADRIGQTKILLIATTCAGLAFIPLAFSQNIVQLILFNALAGAAAGGVLPSANAIIANLTPARRRGAVYGAVAAAASLGGFIGPLGGAALAAAVDIRYTFLVSGILLLLVALWVLVAVRRNPGLDDAEADEG